MSRRGLSLAGNPEILDGHHLIQLLPRRQFASAGCILPIPAKRILLLSGAKGCIILGERVRGKPIMSQTRPNFLFIMTDQLRGDWISCAGHPIVKTSNIDALAAQGTRFANFQATSPVCMPNRASFMTGRYPSTHGLRYNGCLLPLNTNCFTAVSYTHLTLPTT